MEEVLAALDNREKAILVWIAFGVIVALRSKGIRSSLVVVAKTAASRPILAVLAAMVGYISLIVFACHRSGFWNLSMVKDTVYWLLGSALVMVFNHDQANKDTNYFKNALLANLRMVLVLEFLVNFYVFNIFIELVLVPVLFFTTALLAYSRIKKEYAPVEHLMEFVMAVVGFSLLTYAVARFMGDVTSFVSAATLKRFVLPIALTVLFLPFIYALAVYSGYDNISIRVKLWISDSELARHTRRLVFGACLFRLSRVNRFVNDYAGRLATVRSKSDATKLIADFRGSD
jgi:hypothetical protein